ncbi:SWIM zinc finger family protein [Paenibacillus alvei]|uniref:SWIM zinc finger family protein n=1 Tax=Paenibacillus alvei TaxID=44250 RepID=UPI0018CF353B|nr:SWIM zinc finger family protein [Paenibacillus alvei]MBG9733088.1 hypothetical protein [Paenibacillus alvei]MBG9744904.1 hypothetical protein [Paenibacillus alvei]MCY9581763.1 SWIM zinc finger domain-containing protein [Paenibacillus alvei]MCY9586901.1 SWIM zinc finger domain-containing protein [Paenibacillus alvei]
MLQPDVTVDDINRLAGQMKEHFTYATLEQGWRYYRKHAVSRVRKAEGRTRIIQADVHETEHYHVRFHMKRVEESKCTCQAGSGCKHKAAVFFQLCEAAGRKPELYLSDFRHAYIELERQRTAARKREAQKAERERRIRASQMTLSQDASAKEWHLFFHRKYARPFTDFQSSVTEITKWVQEQLYRDSEAMPKSIQTLLRMHVQLFLIQQLAERYAQAARGYHSRDISADDAVRPCMEELRELCKQFERSELPTNYREHVRYLGIVAEQIALSEEESPVDRLAVFALVWSEILNHPDELRLARTRLQERLKPLSELRPRLRDAIRVALIHIESLLGYDEQAIGHLHALTFYNDPERFLQYADERMDSGDHEKLLMWLKALAPMVSQARHRELLERYWGLWKRSYDAHADMHQELEDLLLVLLPGIYPYLSIFLLEQGRYRDWADIQMVRRISPAEADVAEWRRVADAAPSLLLPLYHQAIERHIEERNRDHYRIAVTLLHELRSMYERSGSLHSWERYMDCLYERYSRLRAFQEELRGGALLT